MDRTKLPAEPTRRAIEDRLPWTAPRVEPVWLPATGGLSASAVWRVEHGSDAFAVRRWRVGVDPQRLAWVARTLRDASRGGCRFVAAPLGESDREDAWPYRDAHDGHWEATRWLRGEPLTPSSHAGEVTASLAGLIELHTRLRESERPGERSGSGVLLRRRERLVSIRNSVGLSSASIASLPAEAVELASRLPAAAAAALAELDALGARPLDRQPVHGDTQPEHFLLDGRVLTGLIDFGAMRLDSVWTDVARLAGELARGDLERLDSLAEQYGDAARRPVDRRLVRVLDTSGAVISAANWVHWLSDPAFPRRDPERVRQRLVSIAARLPRR